MPLAGDSSAKIGNRYEEKWTVYCIIQVLRNHYEKIQLGALDEDKAEFYLQQGDQRQYHQAKRQLPQGNWTLKRLNTEGILPKLKRSLVDNHVSWVFVSSHPAPELRELSEQAKEAKSWQQFEEHYLSSNRTKRNLSQLQKLWGNPMAEAVFNALHHIETVTIDEKKLQELNIALLGKLYSDDTNLENIIAILREYISENINAEISAKDIWSHLKQRGFEPENPDALIDLPTQPDATIIDYSIQRAVDNDYRMLAKLVSEDANAKLDTIDLARKEGRFEGLQADLEKLKTNPHRWQSLDDETKARTLCTEAYIEIDLAQNFDRARQLVTEAETYTLSSRVKRLQSWLALYGFNDPVKALSYIEGEQEIDSRNLYSAILLDMGEHLQAKQHLEGILEPNAETYRIRALIHLKESNLNQAELNIEQALSREPKWRNIRFLENVIKYLSAVSALVLGDVADSWPWPPPIQHPLIKLDHIGANRIREASTGFKELASTPSPSLISQPHLWYLATLMTDPKLASLYCRDLLKIDPTHIPTIILALVHQLDIDILPLKADLEKLVLNGGGTLQHELALADIYSLTGENEKLQQFLEARKAEFENSSMSTSWLFHYVKALLLNDLYEQADLIIQQADLSSDERFAITTVLLDYKSRKTENWVTLLQHLEDRYQSTKNSLHLLSYCQVLYHVGEWKVLSAHIHDLVTAIDTSDVNWLAIQTLYKVSKYQECLDLIDDYLVRFVCVVPHNHVLNFRVGCLEELGRLNEAIEIANKLIQEEPTTYNYRNLAHLYYKLGDKTALELLARQVLERDFPLTDILLNLSQLLKNQNIQLAIKLFDKAYKQGLHDDLLGMAFLLAEQLGLNDISGEIFTKLMSLAEQGMGGMKSIALKDLLSLGQEDYHVAVDVAAQYYKGVLPVHLYADERSFPLIRHYFFNFRTSLSNPNLFRNTAIFARHGGKPLFQSNIETTANIQLYMDVTSVLVASNLDILNIVEENFAPIHIPQALIPSLISMEETLLQRQLEIGLAKEQVHKLIQEQKITIVKTNDIVLGQETEAIQAELRDGQVALLQLARESGGYMADFLPLQKLTKAMEFQLSDIPSDWSPYIISRLFLAESLWKLGQITRSKYQTCIPKLQDEYPVIMTSAPLKRDTKIYFDSNAIESLAQADLDILAVAVETFSLFVTEDYAYRLKQELQGFLNADEMVVWLQALVRQLNQGVRTGIYSLLPNPTNKTLFNLGFNTECIHTLLEIPADNNSLIWIDDRYSNSVSFNEVPTAGTIEILRMLVAAGKITVDSYYEYLIKLRAANYRYVPLDIDEILYHLLQAPIIDGHLNETLELKTIRRYIAACMEQPNDLQYPLDVSENIPNKQGEIAFVGGLKLSIYNIFPLIWTRVEDEESRRVYADWVFNNLFVDYMAIIEAYHEQLQDYRTHRLTPDLVALSMQFWKLYEGDENPDKEIGSLVADFTNWIWDRLLKPQTLVNPGLLDQITNQIKGYFNLFRQNVRQFIETEDVDASAVAARLFYSRLPEEIRNHLKRDEEFLTLLGIQFEPVIEINQAQFDAIKFWGCVNDALNGATSTISSLDTGTLFEFHLELGEAGKYVSFSSQADINVDRVRISHAGIVSSEVAEQKDELDTNRYWLDRNNQALRELGEKVSHTSEPYERVKIVDSVLEDSATIYYAELAEYIKPLNSGDNVLLRNLLPPSFNSLSEHLRLPANMEDFSAALNQAIATLQNEEGIVITIQRISCLPIPFPEALLEGFRELNKEKQNIVIKSFTARNSSIALVHLLTLYAAIDNHEEVERLLTYLLSSSGYEYTLAFLQVLNWVDQSIQTLHDTDNYDSVTKLALVWLHTHYLFSIWVSNRMPPQAIIKFFSRPTHRITAPFKGLYSGYHYDIANPARVDAIRLTLCGIAYAATRSANTDLLKKNQESLVKFAFVSLNGDLKPNRSLLRDNSRSSNLLLSFFSIEYAVLLNSSLPEGFGFPSNDEIYKWMEETLTILIKEPHNQAGWFALNHVLQDLPIYPEMQSKLLDLLLKTEYLELYRADISLGYEALNCAFRQLPQFKHSGLSKKAHSTLTELVLFFANQEDKLQHDYDSEKLQLLIRRSLIEPTLDLASVAEDQELQLVELFNYIVDTWNMTVSHIRPLVEHLHERAEANDKRKYWALLMKLRARDTEGYG